MMTTTKEPDQQSSSNTAAEEQGTSTTSSAMTTTTPTAAATTSSATDSEISEGARRLAEELRPFVPQNTLPESAGTADLQLTICRKLRELLPSNKDLLHTAQDHNWIPTILTWLNLHDRPAVQVEALLALTNIAELCAQQSYLAQAQQQTSAVAAAAQAAVSAVKGWSSAAAAVAGTSSLPASSQASVSSATAAAADAMEKYAAGAAAASNKFYTSANNPLGPAAGGVGGAAGTAGTGAPGSVPFPPLSFSQTLSPEAVAAFDASLTSTIAGSAPTSSSSTGGSIVGGATASITNDSSKDQGVSSSSGDGSIKWPPIAPTAPLFPANPMTVAGAATNTAPAAPGGGGSTQAINFSSLAPPPGGAHASVPSNAFLPPPTPVTAPNFPQQLSASSQHLLLRHADAIPTLISLLSSPNREVYEQAVWILGSIAAGDAPGAAAAAAAAAASGSASSSASAAAGGTGTGSSTDANSNKSVSARDVILAAGIMSQLLRCLEAHPNNLSLQRIGSWTLSNLVDGIFQQPSSATSSHAGGKSGAKSALSNSGNNSSSNTNNTSDYSSADEIDMNTLLPVLRRLLRTSDSEVLGYTCWTLSHLCDGPSSHIAAVVTTPDPLIELGHSKGGLVPRLVELLLHPSWRVTKPALRTIGNIVCAECSDDNHSSNKESGGAGSGVSGSSGSGGTGNSTTTDYTEVILECDAVPRLRELVTHSNREIQKEACWTLSNIAAGTVDQIQAVIDSGAIPPLVQLVRDKRTDQEVRSEACWVVLNATSCGSDSQIEVLVDEGCVSVLGVLLSEASMVMMALEGLERVLQVEETREIIRREQIKSGDIEDTDLTRTPTLVSASLIEKARESHNNSSAVTKRADRIWKQHFVSCALCKKSFSKHRTSDASFCNECKCHVCCNCNCKIYHLDYQEELWAATEEENKAKKNAKKSKNKKKKAKLKERKQAKQQSQDQDDSNEGQLPPPQQQGKRGSLASEASDVSDKKKELDGSNSSNLKVDEAPGSNNHSKKKDANTTENGNKSPSPSFDDEDMMDDDNANVAGESENAQSNIDFVLYLQQTGSIIALAKLMDALEYAGDDYDEELNDYERKMIREQQSLREQQQASSAH